MSGYGTKKPGGDRGVQLTFPSVFQDEYHHLRLPVRYYPTQDNLHATQWAGTNDPAIIHNEWAKEAHNMVRNGVYATRIAKQRAFSSPNGYYGMPKNVRSQRKVGFQTGALQSGNIGSALGNDTFGGYVGGVLRTKQGQEYAQKLLRMRAEQLSKLEGVVLPPREMSALSEMGVETETDQLTQTSRVELQNLMESLLNTFIEGDTFDAKTSEQLGRFIQLLLRFAVFATKNELDTIKSAVSDMDTALAMFKGRDQDKRPGNDESAGQVATLSTQQRFNERKGAYYADVVGKLLLYIDGMITSVNLSTRDKKNASQALVRSLGLGSLQRIGLTAEERNVLKERRKDRYKADVRALPQTTEQDVDELPTEDYYRQVLRGIRGDNIETDGLGFPVIRSRDGRRMMPYIDQEDLDRLEASYAQRLGQNERGRDAQEQRERGEPEGDGRAMLNQDQREFYSGRATLRPYSYVDDGDAEEALPGANIGEAFAPPRNVPLEDVARGSRGEVMNRYTRERMRRFLGRDIDLEDIDKLPMAQRVVFLRERVLEGAMDDSEDSVYLAYEVLDGNASQTGKVFGQNARWVKNKLGV